MLSTLYHAAVVNDWVKHWGGAPAKNNEKTTISKKTRDNPGAAPSCEAMMSHYLIPSKTSYIFHAKKWGNWEWLGGCS